MKRRTCLLVIFFMIILPTYPLPGQNTAENLKGRLLIVHGTYDDNVHPQNSYAFINSLIKNNIPFELMIYPWRKHGIRDAPARIHLYSLMLVFWKRNLK